MGGINWCTLFMSRNKKYHFRLFSGNISNMICPLGKTLYKYLLFTIQFEGKCFIYILSAVLTADYPSQSSVCHNQYCLAGCTCKNTQNELTITTYRLRRKITNGGEKTEKYKIANHQTAASNKYKTANNYNIVLFI